MLIRPLRPDDASRLRAFFDGLSDETRRLRFLERADSLTEPAMRFFSDVDQERHVALVCEHEGRLVGDARYTVNPSGRSCEFGIVVADAMRGTGVARPLMEALIGAAREHGLERMKGLVLRSNGRMLRFVQALGFELDEVPDDPSVLRATKRLKAKDEETSGTR